MMDELKKAVNGLVADELGRAKAEHGERFSSLHEGYGVLSEEVQEAREELRMIGAGMVDLICSIHDRDKDGMQEDMSAILRHAELLACEAIQVAAMAEKIKEGVKSRED